ncbi:hypothetical protein ScPMuIL_000759 [Solemya velum]
MPYLNIAILIWIVIGPGTGHIVVLDREKILRIMMNTCGPQQLCEPRRFEDEAAPVPDLEYCSMCAKCYCDVLCREFGDCCLDVEMGITSPTTNSQNRDIIQCTGVTSFDVEFVQNRTQFSQNLMADPVRVVHSCASQSPYGEKCTRPDVSDFPSIVPVISVDTHLTYRNKYCALCNGEKQIEPYRYLVFCNEYSALNMVNDMDAFMDEMHSTECHVRFKPPEAIPPRTCTKPMVRRVCEYNAEATGYDPLIQWACEESDMEFIHIDIFCTICNINLNRSDLISKCDAKKTDVEEKVARGCQVGHKVGKSTPQNLFKNVYCFWCNMDVSRKAICLFRDSFMQQPFDHLFDLTKLVSKDERYASSCEEGFYYDVIKKFCRAILCPPGRSLVDGQCEILYRVTRDLRYQLSLQLSSHPVISGSLSSCQDWNRVVIEEIMTKISIMSESVPQEKLYSSIVKFVSYDIKTSNGKFSLTQEHALTYTSTVHTDLWIGDSIFVDREAVENMLLSVQGQQFSVIMNTGTVVNVSSQPYPRPSSVNFTTNETDECILVYKTEAKKLPSQHVSHLLQCPQIQLGVEDFVLDGITWILQVINSLFDTTELSYVANILNAAQGIFIFVSFTCNRRVLAFFRVKMYGPTGHGEAEQGPTVLAVSTISSNVSS